MNVYNTVGPNGQPRSFIIEGAEPNPEELQRIYRSLNGLSSQPAEQPVEEEPGILGQFGRGIGRGIDTFQAGLATEAQRQAELSDDGKFFGKTAAEWLDEANEQRRQASTLAAMPGGFFGQEGIYDKTRYLSGVMGESFPAMVGGIGATIAGAAAGTAMGGPLGAVAGGIGGAALGTSIYYPQLLNENAERQIEQHGFVKDWGAAAGTAAAGAALESVTDRVTLGVAGLIKKPVSAMMKKSIENGVKKATTIAAKRMGEAAAVGAVSEGTTEVLQSYMGRWQADMETMDDEAKAEYLEGAVVGAILGGVFGGAFGIAGAKSEISTEQSDREAWEDAQLERDTLSRDALVNPERNRKEREAPYAEEEVPEESVDYAGLLTDRSGIETSEEIALRKEPVPPGVIDDAGVQRAKKPTSYGEDEYLKAVELLRNEKMVSPDKIKTTLGVGRPKARAIFDEMLRRNDASPAGSQGQYLKITTPEGIASRPKSNVSGDVSRETVSRRYEVEPVDDTAANRYRVRTKDKELGTAFRTEEQAREWAQRAGIPSFTIQRDNTGQQYGAVEKLFETDKQGEQRLVGKRVLNTFTSPDQANAYIRDYYPEYSPETNDTRRKLTEEEKRAQINADREKSLEPIKANLQSLVDTILGKGRAEVQLPEMVNADYLRKQGVAEHMLPKDNVIVEAANLPKAKEGLRQIIAASSDLYSGTPEQIEQRLRSLVGGHEVIHALRNADLLTPKEWKSLVDYGTKAKVPGKNYTWEQRAKARNPSQPLNVEEMIAEMFRGYVESPTSFDAEKRGLFKKLLDFVKALLKFGNGRDGRAVMSELISGEIGQRPEGYGGLGTREYREAFFSKIVVDPFFSKAHQVIANHKQPKASGEQWMGILRNAGVKQEELDWLGLDQWFKMFDKNSIPRDELSNFIKANSLQVMENWRTGDDFNEENNNGWESYTQAGGENYTTAAFFLPEGKLIPEWDGNSHYHIPNVLAFTRFKERTIDGKRMLFIEEIQSDLHQQGSRYGYSRGQDDAVRISQLRKEKESIYEYSEKVRKQENDLAVREEVIAEKRRDANRRLETAIGPDRDAINQELGELDDELYEVRDAYSLTRAELSGLYDAASAITTQMERINGRNRIPNAPLKSSWEDFVIKRLIRYAAENEFDAISWHGEAQSVADTENYGNIIKEQSEFKKGSQFKGGMEDWANAARNAYEAANDAGEYRDAEKLYEFMDGLRRGESPLDLVDFVEPELMDKYFPASGGLKYYRDEHEGNLTDITAIVNRYLEKMPRIAKQIGKKYGAKPYVIEAEKSNEDFDFVDEFDGIFDNIDDVQSFIANQLDAEWVPGADELRTKLTKAVQIYYNQRTPDLDVALRNAYVTRQELADFLPEGSVMPDTFKEFDQYGNPNFNRWVMEITQPLKDAALHEGFAIFSAIDPDAKNYEGFEIGTKIPVTPVTTDDELIVPSLAQPRFSGVTSNKALETRVMREISRLGYTPYTKQKLAKAKLYDRGLTPYGQPLEETEPKYARNYILSKAKDGNTTPVLGSVAGPKGREAVVFHHGGDWFPKDEGVHWPIGYGFNHSVWHHQQIAKDLGVPNDRMEMLKLFIRGLKGDIEMDRGNMGVITYQEGGWKKPLKIVLQRFMAEDNYFRQRRPAWKFITAYTNEATSDVRYSTVEIDPEARYSASAASGQKVPMRPPAGTLARVEAAMMYNNLAPRLQSLGKFMPAKWRHKFESGVEGTFIAMQDKMLPVGKMIDRIRKNGGFISNETDTYLRATLFDGQTENAIIAADRNFYKPLAKAVAQLGITDEQKNAARNINQVSREIVGNYPEGNIAVAELYLYAQHAQERNAVMRKRNVNVQDKRPDQFDHGSGMSDLEAREILTFLNAQPYADKLSSLRNPNSIRSLFRKVIDHTNNVRVTAGLNPDFRTMVYEDGTPVNQYADYAPLRGWIDEHLDHDKYTEEFAKTSRGFRISGKEDKSAVGRRTIGDDLIAHAILQNEEAIVRAGKNKVARSFVDLIRQNPDQMADVAEIVEVSPMKPVLDQRTGRVRMVSDLAERYADDVLVAKEDGKEVRVKIKDDRVAQAMNIRSTSGNGGAEAIVNGLRTFNKFLAAFRTSYNPEFLVSNVMRDLQTGLINLTEMEMRGLRSEIVKSMPGAWAGIREALNKEYTNEPLNSQWARDFRELRRNGGMTAFMGLKSLNDAINEINAAVKEDVSGPNLSKSLALMKKVGGFVEKWNNVFENGIRLAAYRSLRERFVKDGADPVKAQERAAFIAKELTVNFNKGGTQKPLINALYLFYNASMQGSMAMIAPFIRNKKVRRVWAGVLMAGILQDVMNSMISPEDDDGVKQYDKIPDYILETNIVLMDPTGMSERGYWKIPIPYLMNGIYNFGRASAGAMRGRYTPGEAFNSAFGTVISALDPWGSNGNFLNMVMPTVLDPVVDIGMNRDFTGRPIAPPENPFGGDVKASQRYWNNTSPVYTSIADWMSRITGSDGDYLPGGMEYSPNQIEYVTEWLGGGVWTFARRSFDFFSPVGGQGVLYDMFTGEEDYSLNDIPMVRRVLGNVTVKEDLQFYIRNRDRVLSVRRELRSAAQDGDAEHYQEIMRKYPREYRLSQKINKIENARRKISRQINKVRDGKLPDEQKNALIKQLKDRQEQFVEMANAMFRESF